MVQYKDAINIIKKYENILKTKQENKISITYKRILKTILNQQKQFACQEMNLNLQNHNRCQQNNK